MSKDTSSTDTNESTGELPAPPSDGSIAHAGSEEVAAIRAWFEMTTHAGYMEWASAMGGVLTPLLKDYDPGPLRLRAGLTGPAFHASLPKAPKPTPDQTLMVVDIFIAIHQSLVTQNWTAVTRMRDALAHDQPSRVGFVAVVALAIERRRADGPDPWISTEEPALDDDQKLFIDQFVEMLSRYAPEVAKLGYVTVAKALDETSRRRRPTEATHTAAVIALACGAFKARRTRAHGTYKRAVNAIAAQFRAAAHNELNPRPRGMPRR
jgi:hypothetical protein